MTDTTKSKTNGTVKQVAVGAVILLTLAVMGWVRADAWRMEDRIGIRIKTTEDRLASNIKTLKADENRKDDRIFKQLQRINTRLDNMSTR